MVIQEKIAFDVERVVRTVLVVDVVESVRMMQEDELNAVHL
jgi:hypothetical protein